MKKNLFYVGLLCFLVFAFGVALLEENWITASIALIAIVAALYWQRSLTNY